MYAVVDIETTGGSPKTNKITEIAIYIFDGEKIIDSFETLVYPERRIPPYITQMTGITNEMVEDAPKFFEIAKQIVEITENRIFVAHNASFDYSFVKTEFEQLGFDFQRQTLCTVKLSRKVLPGHKSYSLGNICNDLGINIRNRHRASGDAYATVLLLKHIIYQDNLKKNSLFINTIIDPSHDIEPYKKLTKNLPETTGVYYLLNEKHEIIYIGKSKNIKNRVTTHLTNLKTKRSKKMQSLICSVDYEVTGSELIALLLESQEIKHHKPIFNRAQRRAMNVWGIKNTKNAQGYFTLKIVQLDEIDIPMISFKNKEAAKKFLFKICESYKLCQKLCGLYDSEGQCFQFQIGFCNGACTGKEDVRQYNKRFVKALGKYQRKLKNCYLIDKGRNNSEKSIVRIANGKYVGFGYADLDEIGGNLELLNDCIKSMKDNHDTQQIIKRFIRKNKVERIVGIDE